VEILVKFDDVQEKKLKIAYNRGDLSCYIILCNESDIRKKYVYIEITIQIIVGSGDYRTSLS